jgi:sulfate adenylyltransferase subunit 1
VDLALLTDGLEAEREQGITIDVAYRYFATAKRKFIVADAPGHEQYTRNLVTGASQADVAILLVDATRVDLAQPVAGLLAQTKRHSALVRLLGLQHVGVAVNKMDLLDFDEAVFNRIKTSIEQLAATLGLPVPQVFPVSALQGDNIVEKSGQTTWYQGPSLLQWLEDLEIDSNPKIHDLRFPVQYVARQDGSAADDFRGYLGRIESGTLTRGQKVRILPGGQVASVAEIHVANDHLVTPSAEGVEVARAGQVVAVRLTEDVDISRGDLIVSEAEEAPALARQISADICWLDSEPLSLARKYVLRHSTNTVFAKVKGIQQVLDVETLSHSTDIHALSMNEIGRIDLVLQKPIATDLFDDAPATGAFVLIDEATHHTVAAGMVRAAT